MCKKATTELEIKGSNGQARTIGGVSTLKVVGCKTVVKAPEQGKQNSVVSEQDEVFVKVEASKISLNDEFMKFKPKTNEEQNLKKMIETAVQDGLKDFWRPKFDPSTNKNHTRIFYKAGEKPAIKQTYKWWTETAKKFYPERKSRLGTKNEYVAFLAVLIKKLVASGWEVSDAWYAVCNDSKQLGHYMDSKDGKYGLERTGSTEICGFFDLANTYKILAGNYYKETCGLWLVGGNFNYYGSTYPLADFHYLKTDYCGNSVGWLVLES